MTITLFRLKNLAAQCEALSDANVLGFMTDIGLDAIRDRAIKRIQKEPGFKELQQEKQEIFKKIAQETEGYEQMPPQQKNQVISTHPDFVAFREKEDTEFWAKEINDIEFDKAVLKADIAQTQRFRDNPYADVTSIDNMGLKVPLYPSLKELIRTGFITIE